MRLAEIRVDWGFFFLEYVQSHADLYSKLTHWIKYDNTVNTSESIYPTA